MPGSAGGSKAALVVIPTSVIARSLPDARLLLEEAGVRVISITETAPPAGPLPGPMRVVRERRTEEGMHLVAAASIVLGEPDDRNV